LACLCSSVSAGKGAIEAGRLASRLSSSANLFRSLWNSLLCHDCKYSIASSDITYESCKAININMLASSRMLALRIIVAAMVLVATAYACRATSWILNCLTFFACFNPLGPAMTKPRERLGLPKFFLSSIAPRRMLSDSSQSDDSSYFLLGGVFTAFLCIHLLPHQGTSFTMNQTCWNKNYEFLGLLIRYNSSA
jgi:hypothetical protein